MDYRFRMNERPFKFTAEAYYKALSNLIPYNVQNVKITYYGEIVAAYILEDWFSLMVVVPDVPVVPVVPIKPFYETVLTNGTSDKNCRAVFCLKLKDNTGNDSVARKLVEDAGFKYDNYGIIYE